ncbi:LytTR family DNA-binding domain-containing protein [Lentibacillus saliphilus]|uniref:LytTR family DNA-binding domain-containing protein n=1 Tax=Lentibacillus saliphilus TaxID=2737028 RepID=UPI001C30994B|nr:LytTR family DNA-binding domain-containing protein [Lentibacillus saliphilus]
MEHLTNRALLNVVGELFSDELSIAVANKDTYIYYRPSKRIDLKIKPGDPVKEGTIAHKALNTGQHVSEFIDRNIFGVPYHGMAAPIEGNGEVEGCVMAISPALTEGKSVITVKTADGWRPLPFDDVKYLEVKARKTYVIADGYTGTHKYPLQSFEYMLPRELFVRCHRSFIVNVQHIREIFPDTHSTFVLEMDDGAHVPVSQTYASYFRKLLGF